MRMRNISPSPALKGIVRRFTIVETDEIATRTLIPEAGMLLGLRYRGASAVLDGADPGLVPDFSLTGIRNNARIMQTSARSGIVIVGFREGGASSILRGPLDELFNVTTKLSDFVAVDQIAETKQAMANAMDDSRRIAAVERFLLRNIRQSCGDPLAMAAARAMRATRGVMPISQLAGCLGVSLDRLEKRFRAAVGTTPKQFCSILRFRNAVGAFQPRMNLVDVALEAGYYDQPHFIHEFRAVTGMAPKQFFRDVEFC